MVLLKCVRIVYVLGSKYLYIPIWYYLNDFKKVIDIKTTELYIPIWYYLNLQWVKHYLH